MKIRHKFAGGLALMALAGSGWAQSLPELLAPPPASACPAPLVATEPGNVHMFPGRWWNPQRNGIGWDFFYGEGQQSMYLTWFTYDATGRPVWLHGENKSLQFNAVTGERTWQSNLYEIHWTFGPQGRVSTPVGSVSVTFPNQTTTRAAVRWRWNLSSSIAAVGPSTYDECLYDTFRDQRALRSNGEGLINQAFSSNWFYRGVNEDPLVGWGVDLLVDIDPDNDHYIETAAAAIFDTSGRPAWLQSKDDWGTTAPSDDTMNLPARGALRYLRYQTVGSLHPAVTVCESDSTLCGPGPENPVGGEPDTYGRFARRIDDAANGRMLLTADVSATVTGGAPIDWPPPNNVPPLPDDVPVMRFDSNHVIVDKTICRVPSQSATCTFQVSWSTNDPAAQIRRLDLNNGGVSSPFASGLSAVEPDALPVGARVQYEITYRYNGTGVETTLRTPEVRVLLEGAIADANVQNIACTPNGNNGCDLPIHDARTGAIAGEASTDGGAAQYSIPITVPPGRNGVEPKLSLSYSSRSGNGVAGLGWSLSGLSSIHRCPKTVAQDGANNAAAVTLSGSDALCLDGQRLVVTDVNGNASAAGLVYGASGAYYRTEINSFARVTQYGGNLASPTSCFKVEHKSGAVSYYGGVSDGGACTGGRSRQVPFVPGQAAETGLPLSWNIERERDASGNSIGYFYTAPGQYGKGEKLLDYIRYTGKDTADGDRYVFFFYDPRPDSDRSRTYMAGTITERTQLLKRISTAASGIAGNSYTLNYVDPVSLSSSNLHSGRSALQSIRQCASGGEETQGPGAGGNEVCLPETVVAWNDLPPDHVLRPMTIAGLPEPSPDANGGFVDRRVQTIGDLDGDGVREVLVTQRQSDNLVHTWLVKQNADRVVTSTLDISSIAGSMLYYTQGMQTDYDGDGRADLVAADEGAYLRLYRWNLARGANFAATPAATFTTATLTGVAPGHQLVSSDDLDGDGQSDLLLRRRGSSCSSLAIEDTPPNPNGPAVYGHILCYYRNTTASPAAVSFAAGVEVHNWSHDTLEGGLSPVGDLNGDGTADLVITTQTPQAGGVVNAITTVLLSKTTGLSPPGGCTATSSPAQWYACTPTAMNLPTTNTGYRSNGAAMRWHDVNGDGLVDLLYALPGTCSNTGHSCTRGSWAVQITNGRGFDAEVGIGGNTDALLMTTGMEENRLRYAGLLPSADVDSDGKADLLYPVALAARQCSAVHVSYTAITGDLCDYEWPNAVGGEAATEICEARVWMCGNDPAADIAAATSQYQLPYVGDMPATPFEPAITTDNIYSVRTHKASFAAADQSLYYMAGLRFVATATGYDAQSFSLDASAGSNRAAHRVAMTLNDTVSNNNAEDLYGDGLGDLTTQAGCYNAGISDDLCHFVGDGSTGPKTLQTGPTPNAAPVAVNVSTFNDGLRSFVNENVGVGENGNSAPVLPGLVRLITNGLGDRTGWTYYPLSSKAYRTAGQLPLYTIPADGYVDANHFYFQSTMPVVGSMASSAGSGGLLGFRTWRYGYSEAMYNRIGRGFQGFRAIVREQAPLAGDQPRAIREVTQFHQKYPLTGRIELTRSGAPLATIANQPVADWVYPFTEVSYSWGCRLADRVNCPTAGAPSIGSFDYPFLNAQTTTSFDVALAEAGTRSRIADVSVYNFNPAGKATAAGWDAFGNLTNTYTESRDIAETPGSIAFVTSKQNQRVSTYVNTINSSTWWPGQLTATDDTISAVQYGSAHPLPADASTPSQTLHTDYTWNANRTPATVTVENGDPTLRMQKVFTYPSGNDNYGLPTTVSSTYYDSVVGSNVTRTTQTLYGGGSDGYFPTSTIDATGAETQLVYRKRDGQARETTLPTQVRVRAYFDAFGRTIRNETFKVSGGSETPLGQAVHMAWNPCVNGVCTNADIGSGGQRIDNPGSPAEAFAAYRITTVQNGTPTSVVWNDLLHREVKSATRGFDGTFVATLTEYDRMGALAKKSVPFFLTSASSAAPFASSFSYDRAGRLTSKTAPDGEIAIGQTPPAGRYLTTTYSYAGNRTTVQLRNSRNLCSPDNLCVDIVRYSGVLGLMRTDDALLGVTRYWADAASRPVAIADAKTNAQYPGAIPAGKVTRATYNKLGHRTNAADPNQGSWNFVYNSAGELVQQTDARAIGTTVRRDNAGRPVSRTTWIPGWEGQPAEHYRDEWFYRAGDGLLDDTRRCVASSAPSACLVNNQIPNTTGNTVWRESYVYDFGRLVSVNAMQRVGASELTYPTLFHYDGNYGREKAVEYASGLRVLSVFTKYGALRDKLDADTGERFWGIGGLDAFGNVTRQDYGNGVVGDYSYDAVSGRPMRKQWSRLVNGVTQVLDSVDYGYDALANVSAQRRVVPGLVDTTESYSYDRLQRLLGSSATGSGYSVAYDYDALGNLTKKTDYSRNQSDAYQYASANGCGPNVATTILMPTGAAYDRVVNSCDANGNVTASLPADVAGSPQGAARKIRYDATNRPRYITDPSAPSSPSAQFTYAPDGRRVYEVLSERYFPNPGDVGVNRLRYIVQGQRGYQVELMNDASGWSTATYRHELGDVSVVLRSVPGNTGLTRDVSYKILDRVGSPLGVMDQEGKFRQRSENGYINNADTRLTFSPFGSGRNRDFQPRAQNGEMPGRINLTPATRQGFTGHEHLDSLGLIHMNGRVYDHRLGRFLSVDPFIQFPANSQSLNPYSYVMNNPFAGTDPSGYKARGLRKPYFGNAPCMGDIDCEYQQTFSGPVSDLRNSFQSGGAPSSVWNGRESASIIPKVKEVLGKAGKLVGVVEVGDPIDVSSGVMLAQNGTMSRAEYDKYMGKENPKSQSEKVAATGRAVGDAMHDFVEPSILDVFPFTKLRKLKRVEEAAEDVRDISRGKKFLDGCCCFPAGTLVWAENGPVEIQDIEVGQLVYSRNPETGETTLKPVTALVLTKPKPLYELVVRRMDGTIDLMSVTDNHPYWVRDLGWMRVDELQAGMILSDLAESDIELVSIALTQAVEPTYNFTVADFHTYFAGDLKVLVHNCNCYTQDVLDAANRVGVKMEDAKIVDGMATMKINFSATLDWSDVVLIKGAMRDRGATMLRVESGFIGNDKLEAFLLRRVEDGKPFQGGTVRMSEAMDSDFVIDFPL